MNYDTLHQNFILLAPVTLNQYLADGTFWQTFTDCLTPLVSPIKGMPHVKAAQYDGRKAVKLGRLSWRADVLQKLTDNYRQSSHPDTFFFEFLSAYFPNLSSCVKQNETPKLTLALEQPYNQSYSSLLLSLRQDYFDDLGAAFVSDTVNRLSQHIGATLRLHKQRPYAYPVVSSSHGAWTDSIQDLSAHTAAEWDGGKWHIAEAFADWAAF